MSIRIKPNQVPRLEFFVLDSSGVPVTSLTRTSFSAFGYKLITDNVFASTVTVSPSSDVAATAAKVSGQFVTIDSARGHYAVDCPSAAALASATHVEITATPNTGTYSVRPVRYEIEPRATDILAQINTGSSNKVVERSPSDTKPITFRFPVSGATITGVVSKDNADEVAVVGDIDFYQTDASGKHWYTLVYDVADRPSAEGTARYKFTDGTYTVYVTLRVTTAALDSAAQSQINRIESAVTTPKVSPNIVERSLTDNNPLTFSWPVSGATITGEVSINNADYVPVEGDIDFLRTEDAIHWYTLAKAAADRPSTEGTARYKMTDGTYTIYVVLRIAVATPPLEEIAEALLGYDWESFVGEPADRSMLNALRHIRNKWVITGQTKTVMKEDNITPAFTTTITADGNGNITADTPN